MPSTRMTRRSSTGATVSRSTFWTARPTPPEQPTWGQPGTRFSKTPTSGTTGCSDMMSTTGQAMTCTGCRSRPALRSSSDLKTNAISRHSARMRLSRNASSLPKSSLRGCKRISSPLACGWTGTTRTKQSGQSTWRPPGGGFRRPTTVDWSSGANARLVSAPGVRPPSRTTRSSTTTSRTPQSTSASR